MRDVHSMWVTGAILWPTVWRGIGPHPPWSCALSDWRLFCAEVLSISPAEVGLFPRNSKGTLE